MNELLLVIHPGYVGDLEKKRIDESKIKSTNIKLKESTKKNYSTYLNQVELYLKKYNSLIFVSSDSLEEVKKWLKRIKPKKYQIILTPYGDPVPLSISTNIKDFKQSIKQYKSFFNKYFKDKELLLAGELLIKRGRGYHTNSCVKQVIDIWTKGEVSYKQEGKWVDKKIKLPKARIKILHEACYPNEY